MNVQIFYGSKTEFAKILPDGDLPTIVDLAIQNDAKRNQLKLKYKGQEDEEEAIPVFANVVAYSDDYPALTEGVISSFVSFIYQFDIENLFLQNPPDSIAKHIGELASVTCVIKHQEYKKLSLNDLKRIRQETPGTIIGQPKAQQQIIATLYNATKETLNRPCVMLFYGKSGVGKTETAKYLSSVLGEKLFRKQFSMLHSEEFTSYLFGGRHSQNSLAKELLERESNVILLDEFDKPNPVFYSAFYQLFDDGVLVDKNYTANADNAIIICTSNFQSEEQIKERLGEALFYRFDAIIKFEDLPIDAVETLMTREFEKQYASLNQTEKAIVDSRNLRELLLSFSNRVNNARQIRKFIRDAISSSVIDVVLDQTDSNEDK